MDRILEFVCFIIMIVLLYLSVKDLRKNKKLPNNSFYNGYQNSRYYRLLIIVIVGFIATIVYVIGLLTKLL